MPLRLGSLRSIAKPEHRDVGLTDDKLCVLVLEQMLSALDYLASERMCHRDVKPENIIYYWVKSAESPGEKVYTFQLADFGLVNHQQQARTECGTAFYRAPESYPAFSTFAQSPKMDVWSLFATIADIHSRFAFPPIQPNNTYADVVRAIRIAAQRAPHLAPMVREDPKHRASAAQLLVAHFGGCGLTTQASKVEPIAPEPAVPNPTPAPRAPAMAHMRRPGALPLVKYPRPARQPLQLDVRKAPAMRPIGGGGITKPRAHKPSVQVAQVERALYRGRRFHSAETAWASWLAGDATANSVWRRRHQDTRSSRASSLDPSCGTTPARTSCFFQGNVRGPISAESILLWLPSHAGLFPKLSWRHRGQGSRGELWYYRIVSFGNSRAFALVETILQVAATMPCLGVRGCAPSKFWIRQ